IPTDDAVAGRSIGQTGIFTGGLEIVDKRILRIVARSDIEGLARLYDAYGRRRNRYWCWTSGGNSGKNRLSRWQLAGIHSNVGKPVCPCVARSWSKHIDIIEYDGARGNLLSAKNIEANSPVAGSRIVNQ